MSHLARVQPDATWVRGYITTGADLKALDQNTFVAVNGDDGGTWSPAASIYIGGAGLVLAGPSILSNSPTGIASVTLDGVTSFLTFGRGTADDVFGYAGEQAYTLPTPILEHFAQFSDAVVAQLPYPNGPAGVRALAPGARFLVPLRVYNGGRFQSLTFYWTVGETHTNVPNQVPAIRVIAVDVNGNVTPLRAPDGTTTDVNGWLAISTASTGALYAASLANQQALYLCTVDHVVDLSKYSYFVEVLEESGSGAWTTTGNIFTSAVGRFDQIYQFDGRP
ncbi:MAG: hypothetical protein JWP97_5409 [Labilithrix sp.]|nr:hypothetical protein [Labilithrix sp.]